MNADGLYASIQASLPVFEKQGWKGRIIVVCPPIYSRFFRGKTAYSMAKVAMSVLVKGLAMDWEREGKKEMAVTGIWPAAVSFPTPTHSSPVYWEMCVLSSLSVVPIVHRFCRHHRPQSKQP